MLRVWPSGSCRAELTLERACRAPERMVTLQRPPQMKDSASRLMALRERVAGVRQERSASRKVQPDIMCKVASRRRARIVFAGHQISAQLQRRCARVLVSMVSWGGGLSQPSLAQPSGNIAAKLLQHLSRQGCAVQSKPEGQQKVHVQSIRQNREERKRCYRFTSVKGTKQSPSCATMRLQPDAERDCVVQSKPEGRQKVNVQSIRQNREERKRQRSRAARDDQAVQVTCLLKPAA